MTDQPANESPGDGIEIGRITITHNLDPNGRAVTWCEAVTPDGEPLVLVESLGLLRLAEDTLIRQAMGEVDP